MSYVMTIQDPEIQMKLTLNISLPTFFDNGFYFIFSPPAPLVAGYETFVRHATSD